MGRRAGQPPLTEDAICAAALQLIDDGGLEALSMRRLGAALGVDPMAIYHHLPNKDTVLHAVVKRVFSGMAAPTGRTWSSRVRQWAHAYRAIAEAHPNLVLRIVTDPGAVAVAAAEVNEALYLAIERSGVRPSDVARAADLVVDYVNGAVLGAVSAAAHAEAEAAFADELAARSADEVAAQQRALARAGAGPRGSFDFGLDVIIAGIDRVAGRR